jgi:hypothetical protein
MSISTISKLKLALSSVICLSGGAGDVRPLEWVGARHDHVGRPGAETGRKGSSSRLPGGGAQRRRLGPGVAGGEWLGLQMSGEVVSDCGGG